MAEYIERDAVLSLAKDICVLTKWDSEYRHRSIDPGDVREIPAADVAPVRHGRWIWDKDGMDWGIGAWRCSECKAMSPMWWNADKTSPMHKSGHRYCPNCGAHMDLKEGKPDER